MDDRAVAHIARPSFLFFCARCRRINRASSYFNHLIDIVGWLIPNGDSTLSPETPGNSDPAPAVRISVCSRLNRARLETLIVMEDSYWRTGTQRPPAVRTCTG